MRIGGLGAVLGSMQQEKSLTVIANNLANGATPGYKKDGVHFKTPSLRKHIHRWNRGAFVPQGILWTSPSMGLGFLKVKTDEGVLYTRAGNLTLNRQNMLATQDGWPVLGTSGPIRLTKSDMRVERKWSSL